MGIITVPCIWAGKNDLHIRVLLAFPDAGWDKSHGKNNPSQMTSSDLLLRQNSAVF
jgi:hypothetical protein